MCEEESAAIEYNNNAAKECVSPVKSIFSTSILYEIDDFLSYRARL